MSFGILNQAGELVLHRQMQAAPEPFLQAMAPYRDGLVGCVEGLFTWDRLADRCTQEGLPFVLGHALDLNASQGGTAKNETIDAHQIAVLLRGGLRPQADVYAAARRATGDLRRRRRPRMRQRAELLAQSPQTPRPYNLPELGTKLAYKANRAGGATRLPEPAVQKSLAVDLTLTDPDDRWLTDLERDLVKTAKAQDAQPCSRLRSRPGLGTIFALVWSYAIHAIHRFPRVQACVSSGRLVQCAQEAAGTRDGPSGKKSGQADLPWACSEAAGLCLRNTPAGQQDRARLQRRQGQGNAWTVLAHTLARAGSDLLNRATACAMDKFFKESRSGAREPAASLDAEGSSRPPGAGPAATRRHGTRLSTSALSP